MSWLRAAHFFGIMLWAGGLLALSRLLWARAGASAGVEAGERITGVARQVYWRLALPGLFVALFTGIWMLHQTPILLRQPFMHAKLAAVALLFVGDHVCLRGIAAPAAGNRRYQVVHFGALALLAAVAVLIAVRPWGRA